MEKLLTTRQKEIQIQRKFNKYIREFLKPLIYDEIENVLSDKKMDYECFMELDDTVFHKVKRTFLKNQISS